MKDFIFFCERFVGDSRSINFLSYGHNCERIRLNKTKNDMTLKLTGRFLRDIMYSYFIVNNRNKYVKIHPPVKNVSACKH